MYKASDFFGDLKKGVSQVVPPFNANIGKDLAGAGNAIFGTTKGIVNEVWFTAKGALGSVTGLLDNVGSAINNPLFLIVIGGVILLIVLK